MKALTPKQLKGKFVIASDTLCDGWQCVTTEDKKGNTIPCLFDTEDEAFAEIFDSNHAMLSSHDEENMLDEYNKGVTSKMVKEMGAILESGNVKKMREFMDKHPKCDDSGEWIEPADTFILGRKFLIGQDEKGELVSHIKGKKLNEK